ncbi:FUSC family protein [Amycolatopsis sp. CA-230715]|uniref:FUSC family protein n=1 Tax=Amycolatopsis sp. CA-230715 TaxID=2745196 RepID=UPI001C01226F|nr:FUSC family protein [Amycolatopsis sp. CA-230715]QWF76994.1 hypothetical protein HUW46_00374 [Amycolatopsis sp. CA-230715]
MKGPGMLVVLLVIVGGTAGLGTVVGLGNAAVLAALTALFCLIAALGGPLRADLRLLAVFAPALVVAVGVPRLLGAVSPAAAIALVTVVVFVAGLLPALGSRYVTVGLGLGMASLFGYGFQISGGASAGQIIGAPALAVAVVFVLRILIGLSDPGKATRAALADTLTAENVETPEKAARTWLADRPERWTARVLGASMRYRTARAILAVRLRTLDDAAAKAVTAELEKAGEHAEALATAVRAKESSSVDKAGGGAGLTGAMWSALDAVRDAEATRDRSRVDVPKSLRRQVLGSELRGALSWRSAQLRHAVRCALGMLLALVLAGFRPGDPLTVAFLMGTFAVMQPEWRDSVEKAKQRIAGAMAGAVVVVLVIWLLPPAALLPIALVAVLGGFTVMRSEPVVFNGCMVLMSVGVNAGTRHLDPGEVLVEYVLLILLAAVIGLLFGFAAIPGVRKPSVAERYERAVAAARDMLAAAASALRGDEVGQHELALRFAEAARARQELVTPEPGSAEPVPAQRQAVEDADESLRGLSGAAAALVLGRDQAAPMAEPVGEIVQALTVGAEPDFERLTGFDPESLGDERRLLLDTLTSDALRLHEAGAALAGSSPP